MLLIPPIANFTVSEEFVSDARTSLSALLSSPDRPDFHRVLYILRFSARHQTLRRRFIADRAVIRAFMFALEWSAQSTNESLYPSVMGSLCYLIDDGACDRHHLVKMLILYRSPARQNHQ